MSDAPVTLFIPFGEGYGKPGLTLRSETVAELSSVLSDLTDSVDEEESLLSKILNQTQLVDAGIKLVFPQEVKAPRQSVSSPAAAVPAASNAPSCKHGPKKWRSGVSAKGNDYKGYFCTAPQGATDKDASCSPEFQK